MRAKLYTFWAQLSESFWFIPAVMVGAAMVLGWVVITIDQSSIQEVIITVPWLYVGSPGGARSLLSTIAGSMISVAGVTFSITIATLSLASSQLGPRLLSTFTRDRGNQVALGTFVSIFVYCLLTLRAIRGADDVFVPHVAVLVALVLAVFSVGVLIYFFHHVSQIIQAQHVISDIGGELDESMEQVLFSEGRVTIYEHALRHEDDIPADFDEQVAYVAALSSGYLQAMDYEGMQAAAEEQDVILRLLYRPGQFIARGSDLIAVYPADAKTDALAETLASTFTIGAERLRLQNVEFLIDQLVEIAVRALSPGINDPFTAVACLDQLGSSLANLAGRDIPAGYYYDEAGGLRLITVSLTFKRLVDSSFNLIRQYGRSDVAVTIRMLEVIASIIARTEREDRREALLRQADMIKRASDEAIFEQNDRADIQQRYHLIMRVSQNEKRDTTS